MKHISFVALCSAIMFCPHGLMAAGAVSHLHANGVAANNIAVMQHTLMLNAFEHFDGSMARIIRARPTAVPQESDFDTPVPTHDKYGEMLYYGEYGDDGTVFQKGRNGGDSFASSSLWLDWQHTQDRAKFKDFKSVRSTLDMISIGFSNEPEYTANTYSKFGGFGGVALSHEDAHSTDLSETGEYVGLYYGYQTNGLTLQTAANFGALFTDADTDFGDHDFTNLWAGAAINASYNFFLDNESVLQPNVYAGYTWIRTNNYDPQPDVSTDAFHMFEVSPGLRVITHITDGWYGAMSARYVFNFATGGDTSFAGVALPDLELQNYAEYGLGFEKSIDRFNFALVINRRDGGHTGWNGNIRMRYVF